MALLQSDVAAVKQHVAGTTLGGSATGSSEAETLVKLIEKLQEFILATGDTETINLWLDESIGTAPLSADEVQGLNWNIDRLIAAAQALAQSERQAGPPLLSEARAELLATTGDPRYSPLASWSEIIAALPAGERAIELIALFGTHRALVEAATHAERLAIAALLVHGTADTNGDGRIEASEVAPADRLDFLNATGAYAQNHGGALDIDLRFAGSAAQELLAGKGVVAGHDEGAASAGEAGRTAPVSSGAAVADIGSPAEISPAGEDAPAGPAVDARLQFVRVGLDGRTVDDDGPGLVPDTSAGDGLLLIGGEAADSLAGGTGGDTIEGRAGNDRLSGGEGDDDISGGEGNDVVSGGAGSDTLSGGAGNDLILGGAGQDIIDGGQGDDVLDAGADGGELAGGNGDDVLMLGDADLVASGGDGNDLVVAAGGTTQASGGQGFDWITYTSTHIAGAAASHLFEGQSGSDGDDHLIAGPATHAATQADALALIAELTDYLSPSIIDGVPLTGSILLGGAGSDTLESSSGNDIIDGDMSLSVQFFVDVNANGAADEGEIIVADLADLEDGLLTGAIQTDHVETRRGFHRSDDDRDDVDTVRFSGRRGEYEISVGDGGVTTVTHRLVDASGTIILDSLGLDGIDRLANIERLEFSDEMLVLDFAGMAWIIDGDGDMFVFASDAEGDHALLELGDRDDLMDIDIGVLGTGASVDLVGVYDYMQADYS